MGSEFTLENATRSENTLLNKTQVVPLVFIIISETRVQYIDYASITHREVRASC